MSNDAILFFQSFPKLIWGLMNSFNIPGLGFTPGALIMGVISFDIIIWVVGNMFTFGANAIGKAANVEARHAASEAQSRRFAFLASLVRRDDR